MTELQKVAINKAVDLTEKLITEMSNMSIRERWERWMSMSEFEKECMTITFCKSALLK